MVQPVGPASAEFLGDLTDRPEFDYPNKPRHVNGSLAPLRLAQRWSRFPKKCQTPVSELDDMAVTGSERELEGFDWARSFGKSAQT
jgi:hypothetical protein